MTPEQLQELKEKAELWDSLSDSLRTIFCGKFDRPNGITTIENISNSSSHIGLLEEESKEMISVTNLEDVNFVIKISDSFCEWEYGMPIDNKYSIDDILISVEKKFKVKRIYDKLIKPFNGKKM